MVDHKYISWLEHLDAGDTPSVGGKNASLGEMLQKLKQQGIRIPEGFAPPRMPTGN